MRIDNRGHDDYAVEALYRQRRDGGAHGSRVASALAWRDAVLAGGNKKRWSLRRFLGLFLLPKAVQDEQREAELLCMMSRRPHPPAYASQSTLERYVLSQARVERWGIKAVMIDYADIGPKEGMNWRVTGLISGDAERAAASAAVMAAARKYSSWIMVADTNPLAGQTIPMAADRFEAAS